MGGESAGGRPGRKQSREKRADCPDERAGHDERAGGAPGFYWSEFRPGERAALRRAGFSPDARGVLDDEAAVLRVLIRRALGAADKKGKPATDPEAVGRLIERLARVLRTRQLVAGRGEDGKAIAELVARAGASVLEEQRARLAASRAQPDGPAAAGADR